jgi:2,3-bisphosphoglycerate-independent phosphoglycerate mutase
MVNFRSDRMRQITQLLGEKDFMPIKVNKKDIKLFTMSEYSKDFSFPIIFTKEIPKNTLCETISKAGLAQFHTAETEKYAHVTFFLNGGVEEPFFNETRVLIPSPKVQTYDLKPQMSAYEVKDAVLKAMEKEYDFIVVNFANGDMVGHTGDYEAALKAVEAVDECIGEIVKKCDEKDYSMVLSADHGNCEKMKDKEGNMLTNHTVGEVYCFVRDKNLKNLKKRGGLSNIAPTVLQIMGLDIPKEMDEGLIQ